MASESEHKAFLKDVEDKVKKAVFSAHAVVVEAAPVDTGRLRQSIKVFRDGGDWVIGSNLSYAEFQEVGTRFFEGKFFFQKGALSLRDSLKRIFGGS